MPCPRGEVLHRRIDTSGVRWSKSDVTMRKPSRSSGQTFGDMADCVLHSVPGAQTFPRVGMISCGTCRRSSGGNCTQAPQYPSICHCNNTSACTIGHHRLLDALSNDFWYSSPDVLKDVSPATVDILESALAFAKPVNEVTLRGNRERDVQLDLWVCRVRSRRVQRQGRREKSLPRNWNPMHTKCYTTATCSHGVRM